MTITERDICCTEKLCFAFFWISASTTGSSDDDDGRGTVVGAQVHNNMNDGCRRAKEALDQTLLVQVHATCSYSSRCL